MRIGSARTFAEFLSPFMAKLDEWYLLGERVRATQMIMQGHSSVAKNHSNDEGVVEQTAKPVAQRLFPPLLQRPALHDNYADSAGISPRQAQPMEARSQPCYEPAYHDQRHSDDAHDDLNYKTDPPEESPARDMADNGLAAEGGTGQQRLHAMMGDTRGSGRLSDARAPRIPLTSTEMTFRPCYRKLNQGECTTSECPYSHDNRLLEEVRAKEERAYGDQHAAPRPPKKPGGVLKSGNTTALSHQEDHPTYSLATPESASSPSNKPHPHERHAPPIESGRPNPRELAVPFHVANVVHMLAAPPPRR